MRDIARHAAWAAYWVLFAAVCITLTRNFDSPMGILLLIGTICIGALLP